MPYNNASGARIYTYKAFSRSVKGTVQQSVNTDASHGNRQQYARERPWTANASKKPAILVQTSTQSLRFRTLGSSDCGRAVGRGLQTFPLSSPWISFLAGPGGQVVDRAA